MNICEKCSYDSLDPLKTMGYPIHWWCSKCNHEHILPVRDITLRLDNSTEK